MRMKMESAKGNVIQITTILMKVNPRRNAFPVTLIVKDVLNREMRMPANVVLVSNYF